MYHNTEYHALHDDENDSADLWDQLDDVESREVRQHQSRFRLASPNSRSNAAIIFLSMIQSSAEQIREAVATVWSKPQEAWNLHRHQSRRDNTNIDLDREFGISDLRPSDFEIQNGEQPADSDSRNPFVLLSNFPRQAISSARDSHGLVSNLDVFLSHFYQYYYHRGLVPIVSNFFVEASTLLFTLWFSRILIKYVDWKELATCKDEESCLANWSDYYRKEPLGWIHWWIVEGFSFLCVGYFIFFVWRFWQSLQHALTCQYIMHEKLGISKRKLQGGAVSWDTVVSKLVEVQESGEYRLALTPLDPLVIAQRIMRKENFLIAFWNQNLIDTRIGDRYYWCSSLEWCTHTCVLNFMFNHKYEIRPAFCLDADSLERRLKVCGIVHALLLPFLILFVLLHFLLRNVYDFKTTRQYMGDKYWSSVATWTFREFNELPHFLEQRLEPSCEAAENYSILFGQSEWKAAVGRICVFLGGAVGGVLLLLGVMNDAILLHVQLWGRNLLWYAGIGGIVYSIGKALVPSKEAQPRVTRNLFSDMDAALKNVSKHTHYYPESWKGRGWDANVYASFAKLFDSKVKLFVWELGALLLAPYILFAKLSKCAPAICEFCLLAKASVPNAGDVIGYSTFDFDAFRDEAWEGRTLGKSISPEGRTESLAESMMRNGNVEDATRQHPKPKSRHGKMEKSFFNFQATHPNWQCSPSGLPLLAAVEDYRKAAISIEREFHIQAATRQLDTLARLEQKPLQPQTPFDSSVLRSAVASDHFASASRSAASPLPSETKQSREQVTPRQSHAGGTTESGSGNGPTLSPQRSFHAEVGPPLEDPPSHSNGALPLGLSVEIGRLASMPSLDDQRNIFNGTSQQHRVEDDRRAERQYYWLDRFHAHLENQKHEETNPDRPGREEAAISRSMPSASFPNSIEPRSNGGFTSSVV